MKYLLDTDHISILQRRTGPEYAILAARVAPHAAELAFPIVSFHEQVLGVHSFLGRARHHRDLIRGYTLLGEILQAFATAPVLPFDPTAAAIFGRLSASRLRVATLDLRIAAIALGRGLVLVTRNVRDFGKVPGLVTQDWTIP